MPPTTTTNLRTKRTDARPNGKERKKRLLKEQNESSIQDLRVTKKRKEEKRERELPNNDADFNKKSARTTLTGDERYLRSVKKKAQSIDKLLQLQKGGAVLDQQQLLKVQQLDAVMEQISNILEEGATE